MHANVANDLANSVRKSICKFILPRLLIGKRRQKYATLILYGYSAGKLDIDQLVVATGVSMYHSVSKILYLALIWAVM